MRNSGVLLFSFVICSEFFDAPVAFIFTINQALTQGSWMDVGYFLQSITIAARARGLETVSMVNLITSTMDLTFPDWIDKGKPGEISDDSASASPHLGR